MRNKAAVIGSPVLHSLSPAIFSFISAFEKTPIEYQAMEIKKDQAAAFLKSLKLKKDYCGVNVTIPLKETVMEELDEITEEAKMIGAVNVIQCTSTGSLKGWNTDVIGIEKTFQAQKFSPAGKECLIWGAGGAAKAVATVLGKAKAKSVAICGSGRALEMAQKFQTLFSYTRFYSPTKSEPEKYSLMVNATPVGMKGVAQDGFFSDEFFSSPNALAFDLIYTPEDTVFLKKARAAGMATVGGLEMLIDQAIATWDIWIKPIKNSSLLHAELKKYLKGLLKSAENSAPLFLTGFMGVGKSAVAAELAALTKRELIDTDKVIEGDAGKSVQEIFKQQGETEFRKLEKNAVSRAAQSKNSVVALGGGALMNPESLNQVLGAGSLVYLMADESTLEQRILAQGLDRPLLAGLSPAERQDKIKNLLKDRAATYERAKYKITTVNLQPAEVAHSILTSMGEDSGRTS